MSNDTMPCGCEWHADNEHLCRYPALEQALAAERKRREEVEDLWHAEQQAHTAAVTRAEQAERCAAELREEHADLAEKLRQAERERDDLRREHEEDQGVIRVWRGRCERAEAERDALQRHYDAAGPEHNLLALLDLYDERMNEAKAKCERLRRLYSEADEARDLAEADNAALLALLDPDDGEPNTDDAADAWSQRVLAVLAQPHPGAALLEQMRKQDEDICRMAEEIEGWKGATGLERGGDPDGVWPNDLAREIERLRALEEVHSVACEMNAGDTSTAAWTRLHEALAAYDALTVKP